MHTDPIADMLTRIRNANAAVHDTCEVPHSRIKMAVLKVLKEEGYIKEFKTFDESAASTKTIRVYIKYLPDGGKAITSIIRKSTPGRRLMVGVKNIPKVLDGLGISIVSTPKGIMSDRECRKLRLGGEIICTVW